MEHDPNKAIDNVVKVIDDHLPILCKEMLQFEDDRGKGLRMIYCEQLLADAGMSNYNAQVIVQNLIRHAAVKRICKEFEE